MKDVYHLAGLLGAKSVSLNFSMGMHAWGHLAGSEDRFGEPNLNRSGVRCRQKYSISFNI
jgi:hypothetical protein